MRAFFCALTFALVAACGAPQPTDAAPAPQTGQTARIEVRDAWAAQTPGGVDVSAGYLVIANRGAAVDRLVAASSPRASRVEIHEMAMDGAVMRMRPVQGGLAIPAGGEIALSPGGLHLMFFGVAEPFTQGESIPVRLRFESAGEMVVNLPVRRGATHGG